MSISPTSWAAGAVADRTSSHEVRSDNDGASESFAGILAGAVNSTPRRPIEAKPENEGTSELDRQEETEHTETEETKSRRARSHAHAHKAVAATTDPAAAGVVQSVGALDPELQTKLARVMQRMRDETGHDVKVAETYRSQTRQDALFAQGRDTPGQVVTWTHNSKHTQGRAVDLLLDDGAAPMDAYATLQRIAGEEGLRTLGARDPGHLELAGSGTPRGAVDATSLIPDEPADASGPGQMSIARLAQVAQVTQLSVAKPAEVASVASVAKVATPGDTTRSQTIGVQQAHRTPHASVQSSQGMRASASDTDGASKQFTGDSAGGQAGTKGEHRGYSALAAAVAMRDSVSTHAASGVSSTTGMTAAERAAQVIAAYEDAPARPLSQITMSIDAGNGAADRVQLAMRGSSLNATIDAADARAAQTMSTRQDELVRALSRDGIELDALRVRSAATAAAPTAAPTAQSGSDAGTHSRFERNQNAWQHDRQRSQDDRRQQQRDKRGGQQQ